MAKNRKKATEVLLEQLGYIDKYLDVDNVGRYRSFLGAMSDNQFDEFVKAIKAKKTVIYVYAPNLHKHPSMENILSIAKKVGVQLFERVELYDDITDEWYLTPERHLVVKIPVRRLQQYGDHKMSLPEGDTKTDMLTGQVIHEDRAAGITHPEEIAWKEKNLSAVVEEMVWYRGGNIEAWQSGFKKQAEETGEIELDNISKDSKNRTVVVAQKLLEGLHLETNLVED